MYDYYNSCVYTYLSWFVLLSHIFGSECPFQSPDILWLIVCAYIRLLIVFVFLFLSEYMQYCWAKFVTDCRCIFPSLDPCFSLSVWTPLLVFSCIVTDCTWKGTCLDPRFSLSFALSVSVRGVLLVILRVYVRLLIRISFSLFVSKCV